jgi:hypothetical protein
MTAHTVDGLMTLVVDHSVDSLRVGSHEARAPYTGIDKWKLADLREKRIKSRDAIRTYATALASPKVPALSDEQIHSEWMRWLLPSDSGVALAFHGTARAGTETVEGARDFARKFAT